MVFDIPPKVTQGTSGAMEAKAIYGAVQLHLYSDRALLVDTNLLTTVFPVVLADALDRALIRKQGVVPEVANGTDFVAAEAS
jgi:hypothetical protein